MPSIDPGTFDPQQKLAYIISTNLMVAALAAGGTDAAMPFPTMVASPNDGMQPLLVKIAYWAKQIADNGGGGGGGLTFSSGAADPEGAVVGSPGDTYWNTTDNTYWVKVTGSATNTGWLIH